MHISSTQQKCGTHFVSLRHLYRSKNCFYTALMHRTQKSAFNYLYSNKVSDSIWCKKLPIQKIFFSQRSYSNFADYESAKNHFTLEVPEDFNFTCDVIDKHGADPRKIAMLWVGQQGEEKKITFSEFSQRSAQAAAFFNHLGIEKGDRVLIMLPRIPVWWESVLGLIRLGAIPIPCTPLLTEKDILFRVQAAKVHGCIFDTAALGKLGQNASLPSVKNKILMSEEAVEGWHAYSQVDNFPPLYRKLVTKSKDPCMIYFTSGTVGMPKMVLHTHASYPIGHNITALWADHRKEDLHWNLSDGGWAKAAWGFFAAWSSGTTLFVHDHRSAFNPLNIVKTLHTYAITNLCTVNTAYTSLVSDASLHYIKAHPLHSLRYCISAGEPLTPAVIKAWKEATNITIREGYGQTETTLLCAHFPFVPVKPGSMGKPAPGVDLNIVDESGSIVNPYQEGNIAVRIHPKKPVGFFQEYWNNPQAMTHCMKGEWYYTGDRAYKDEEGYYWFVGRGDDVIKSSGYRIGPFEVESALKTHLAVAESAVVGKPDELRGESVVAFVVLASGYLPSPQLASELKMHVKKETASYKAPREIIFIDELPKTISGKIRRVELRDKIRL